MAQREEITRLAALLSDLRHQLLADGHHQAARLVQVAFKNLRAAGRLLDEPAAGPPADERRVDEGRRDAASTAGALDPAGSQQHPRKARRAARRAWKFNAPDNRSRAGPQPPQGPSSAAPAAAPGPSPAQPDASRLLDAWLREIRLAKLSHSDSSNASLADQILARAVAYSAAVPTTYRHEGRRATARWLVRIAARQTTPPSQHVARSSRDDDGARADPLLHARELLARASQDLRRSKAS